MKPPASVPPIGHVAVLGAGAVGSFYGAMLARAGVPVTLIGRPAHVEAIARDGLRVEFADHSEAVRVAATSDAAAAAGADLVLCCVKSTDTEAAADALAPHLRESTIVMSLQNGVSNAATLARRLRCVVVPTVVYVATSLAGPGVVRHHGRGDLAVGPGRLGPPGVPASPEVLRALVEVFGRAGVAVRIASDIDAELWAKLLVNCAYNAISALTQQPYARLAALPEVVELQHGVVREVVAVAAAAGVEMSLQASLDATARIAQTMPGQLSSTAQDLARGKPSEIDHLNGHVARLARERGVPAPLNQALHALVKLAESGRGRA